MRLSSIFLAKSKMNSLLIRTKNLLLLGLKEWRRRPTRPCRPPPRGTAVGAGRPWGPWGPWGLWLLDRILPAAASMALWATLLIVTATYMGVLQPVAHGAPAWRTLVKGLGLVLLIYGILLLVGVAAGGRDPWQPLRGIRLVAAAATELPESGFRPVKTVADVKQAVQAANGQPVVLDFYADWCVTCRELERETFADSSVRATLAQITALQADVTANNDDDQALLRQFGIVGPPALLFFGPDGKERSEYRIVGFVDAAQFNQQVQRLRQVRN